MVVLKLLFKNLVTRKYWHGTDMRGCQPRNWLTDRNCGDSIGLFKELISKMIKVQYVYPNSSYGYSVMWFVVVMRNISPSKSIASWQRPPRALPLQCTSLAEQQSFLLLEEAKHPVQLLRSRVFLPMSLRNCSEELLHKRMKHAKGWEIGSLRLSSR